MLNGVWQPKDLVSASAPPLAQGLWVDSSGPVPVWRAAVGGEWVAVAGGGTIPTTPMSASLAQTLPALVQEVAATADVPAGIPTVGTLTQTLPALVQALAGTADVPSVLGTVGSLAQTLPTLVQQLEGSAAEPNPTIAVLAQHLPALTQSVAGEAARPSTVGAVTQTLPALTQQLAGTAADGGTLALDDLTDVTITDPQDGQHLVRSASEWTNQ